MTSLPIEWWGIGGTSLDIEDLDRTPNSRHKHISSLRSMRKPMQVAREGRLPYIERGRDRLF